MEVGKVGGAVRKMAIRVILSNRVIRRSDDPGTGEMTENDTFRKVWTKLTLNILLCMYSEHSTDWVGSYDRIRESIIQIPTMSGISGLPYGQIDSILRGHGPVRVELL